MSMADKKVALKKLGIDVYTRHDDREFHALEQFHIAFDNRSIQYGFEHSQVHRLPQKICQVAIDAGHFKEDAYLGRMAVYGDPNFVRAGINVQSMYIINNENALKDVWFFAGFNPEEAFNIALACTFVAATNGYPTLTSPLAVEFMSYQLRAPYEMARRVGRKRDNKMRVFGFDLV